MRRARQGTRLGAAVGVMGELGVPIHSDLVVPDVERDPDDVLLVALPESRQEVADGPGFGFLGDPADAVLVLPEVESPGLLWPGIATEEVDAGVFQGEHENWVFEQPGRYRLVFEVAGRLADGGAWVRSGQVTLAIEVRG